MQDYNYFIILLTFLILFGFFLDKNFNFLSLLIYAESIWTLIYTIICYSATLKGGNVLLVLALFALCIGGLEFSIGLIILRIYKSIGLSIFSLDTKFIKDKNKNILKNFI